MKRKTEKDHLGPEFMTFLKYLKKVFPCEIPPFVRNRVSIIHEFTKIDCWRHVNSHEKPADIISRGLDSHKIKDYDMWWFGPPFLH